MHLKGKLYPRNKVIYCLKQRSVNYVNYLCPKLAFGFCLSGSHEWPLILFLEVVLWSFGCSLQTIGGRMERWVSNIRSSTAIGYKEFFPLWVLTM